MPQLAGLVLNECDRPGVKWHAVVVSYLAEPPRQALRPLVRQLSTSAESRGPFLPRWIASDGGVDLLFSFALDMGTGQAEIFGPKSRALLVHDSSPMEKVAIHLRPGACAHVLGVAAQELRDRVVPLDALGCWTGDLVEHLATSQSWSERKQCLEHVVLRRLARGDASSDLALVECALARITASRGRTPVAELARGLHTTPRTLERSFAQHVGLSPKRMLRIARMQAAVEALDQGESPLRVAMDAGYSDQPHLTRELRELAGVSPASRAAR